MAHPDLNTDKYKGSNSYFDYDPSAGNLDGTIFESWLRPGDVQLREFGQQLYLQDRQNEWNSAQEQMQRAIEAGINPNLAAGKVAGDQSTSVASPNSSVGAGAQGASALASGVDAASKFIGTVAEGAVKFMKLPSELKNIASDTKRKLAAAGLDAANIEMISQRLPFISQKEQASLDNMLANTDSIREQIENYREIRENYKKQRDEIDAHIHQMENAASLDEKLALESEKRKLKIEEETYALQWNNNMRRLYNVNPDAPIANQYLSSKIAGNDLVADTVLQGYHDIAFNQTLGKEQAELEEVYDKELNRAKANADVDAQFAEYYEFLRANRDAYVQLISAYAKMAFNSDGNLLQMALTGLKKAIREMPNLNLQKKRPSPGSPHDTIDTKFSGGTTDSW